MTDRNARSIHLSVGELVLAKEPVVVSTTLGSCVSVCLFTDDRTAGGMVHFALPEPTEGSGSIDGLRYASVAIPRLVEELKKLTGKNSSAFSAKIVGGAKNNSTHCNPLQAGAQNIIAAKKLLHRYGIKIVGESVGGDVNRKVLFHIPSGRLQVAKLSSSPERNKTRVTKTTPTQSPREQKAKRRVLIVDDSKTIRELLRRILETDPELEVVGSASNALEADKLVETLKPDVITLDVHMPVMTGVEWLEKLLPKKPIPVVMITSLQLQEGNEVFRALELGAVDYIQKPSFSELKQISPVICEKIKEASFAKVIRLNQALHKSVTKGAIDTACVLAMGASTGGTEALKSVLCSLPKEIPPTVIVQHIPPVFSKAFSERLDQLCPFEVKEAEDGDELKASRVLIAPGGKQMRVEALAHGFRVRVTDDPPVNRHKPSVDYLFHSVASVVGKNSIGVILTGMGNDGAKGLLAMREKGSRTIGQDEATSVVYGMPRVAFDIGAVETVAPLNEIPNVILNHLTRQKSA